MSIYEVHSTMNYRSLMRKTNSDLARTVLDFADEVERLSAEITLLRTGDTCARHCEGIAFRHEAQRLKAVVSTKDAEIERLKRIVHMEIRWHNAGGGRHRAVMLQEMMNGRTNPPAISGRQEDV